MLPIPNYTTIREVPPTVLRGVVAMYHELWLSGSCTNAFDSSTDPAYITAYEALDVVEDVAVESSIRSILDAALYPHRSYREWAIAAIGPNGPTLSAKDVYTSELRWIRELKDYLRAIETPQPVTQ